MVIKFFTRFVEQNPKYIYISSSGDRVKTIQASTIAHAVLLYTGLGRI